MRPTGWRMMRKGFWPTIPLCSGELRNSPPDAMNLSGLILPRLRSSAALAAIAYIPCSKRGVAHPSVTDALEHIAVMASGAPALTSQACAQSAKADGWLPSTSLDVCLLSHQNAQPRYWIQHNGYSLPIVRSLRLPRKPLQRSECKEKPITDKPRATGRVVAAPDERDCRSHKRRIRTEALD